MVSVSSVSLGMGEKPDEKCITQATGLGKNVKFFTNDETLKHGNIKADTVPDPSAPQ